MKASLLFLCLLAGLSAFSQSTLLLQKRGRTQQTFFAGRYIALENKLGSYMDGMITAIKNDTIFIRHFQIQKTFTEYGGIYFDTVYLYTTPLHYRDITAVMPEGDAVTKKGRGNILLLAGGGVLALGIVNGLYRKEPPRDWFKPSGYITAGALGALGLLSKRSASKRMIIGKKYSLKILALDSR